MGGGGNVTMEDLKQAVLGYLSCDLCGSETDRTRRTLNKAKVKRRYYGKEEGLSMALSNAGGDSVICCGPPYPQGSSALKCWGSDLVLFMFP